MNKILSVHFELSMQKKITMFKSWNCSFCDKWLIPRASVSFFLFLIEIEECIKPGLSTPKSCHNGVAWKVNQCVVT